MGLPDSGKGGITHNPSYPITHSIFRTKTHRDSLFKACLGSSKTMIHSQNSSLSLKSTQQHHASCRRGPRGCVEEGARRRAPALGGSSGRFRGLSEAPASCSPYPLITHNILAFPRGMGYKGVNCTMSFCSRTTSVRDVS